MGQFYTFAGMRFLGERALENAAPITFTANVTAGSPYLSGVSSLAGLEHGMVVTGTGIPANTYIVDLLIASGQIMLSQPATAGGTAVSLSASGNIWSQASIAVHLLVGQIPNTPDASFSSLTEATYDGYTPQTLPYTLVISTPPPRTYCVWQWDRLTFQPVDYAIPNNITGHCFTATLPGATAPTLLAMETYGSSVPLQQPGDILTINPVMSFAFDQTAGPSSPRAA